MEDVYLLKYCRLAIVGQKYRGVFGRAYIRCRGCHETGHYPQQSSLARGLIGQDQNPLSAQYPPAEAEYSWVGRHSHHSQTPYGPLI